MTTSRRSFLKLTAGAAVIIAATAIVRASSLMKVRPTFEQRLVTAIVSPIDTRLHAVGDYLTPKFAWYLLPGQYIEADFAIYGDRLIEAYA